MSTTEATTSRTLRLFLTRGVIAIVWAAVFAAVADSLTFPRAHGIPGPGVNREGQPTRTHVRLKPSSWTEPLALIVVERTPSRS